MLTSRYNRERESEREAKRNILSLLPWLRYPLGRTCLETSSPQRRFSRVSPRGGPAPEAASRSGPVRCQTLTSTVCSISSIRFDHHIIERKEKQKHAKEACKAYERIPGLFLPVDYNTVDVETVTLWEMCILGRGIQKVVI